MFPRISALFFLLGGGLLAGPPSGTVQSTRLYTVPDPAAGGGITGRVADGAQKLVGAYALNAFDFAKVYKGSLSGSGFSFTGLPAAKYDLWLLFENEFYEGSTLHRGENALTARDEEAIRASIGKTVPFFDRKRVHRLMGGAGAEARARAVVQEYRAGLTLKQDATQLEGRARSLKLAMLEDVGTGWIVADTREIVRLEDPPGLGLDFYTHHYRSSLGGLRVTDAVRDLGTINLKEN